jgi:hypothetical protein
MNKIIILKLGEQKWTKRDRCLILSTFLLNQGLEFGTVLAI